MKKKKNSVNYFYHVFYTNICRFNFLYLESVFVSFLYFFFLNSLKYILQDSNSVFIMMAVVDVWSRATALGSLFSRMSVLWKIDLYNITLLIVSKCWTFSSIIFYMSIATCNQVQNVNTFATFVVCEHLLLVSQAADVFWVDLREGCARCNCVHWRVEDKTRCCYGGKSNVTESIMESRARGCKLPTAVWCSLPRVAS